ncbi:unnamed protein product [Bursaphelenchus xylophilus]|uniref:(pine wood nematode) hypothetical protein n=1 Tax=Bursaphelenchus xylophilus TaxID=6326 RepID=A0A7I8XNR4_BURXY|nr:unnamed protein product [Bursaphelenchus xylophilus]CAG9089130.1 unnamed protein product [Bursaphelenchus xylophilus]
MRPGESVGWPADTRRTLGGDLGNFCTRPPVSKVANCGMEAYLSESASVYGHCITDLDTNTTTMVDSAKFEPSARKRSAIYDCFEGVAKRLKL